MTKFINSTLGVTGASGHLGRRTIELLLEAGATRVVGLTRDPARLTDLAGRGVDLRRASFDEPVGLAEAFRGIDRLLIVSTDALETRIVQQRAAIDAADAAGVAHILYTSITSPYPDPTSLVPNSHFWTEARLFAGSTDWTSLRNNQYTDYLLPGAQHAIASGVLVHAAGDGRRAYVTREDCAEAAAGALLKAEGKRIYDIGGPAALSAEELAARLTQIAGKPVRAQNVGADALIAGYVGAGVPQGMAEVLARFDTDTAKGYLGIVGGGVDQLTGRTPQSVAEFLTANQAALAA